jgi:N-acyl-L-homoserine lactone synthetase
MHGSPAILRCRLTLTYCGNCNRVNVVLTSSLLALPGANREVAMGCVEEFGYSSSATVEDTFTDRVARLLDTIDCRLAQSGQEREAIFRLRYQAYLRDEGITPNSSRMFSDAYDEAGNVYLFGLYIGGDLASSVRIHVASRQDPEFPTGEVFPEVLRPKLDAGNVMVDTTRFVVDEKLARLHRALPYATLRLSGMAAHQFRADYLLAAVRAEHQAFYRRVFRYERVCGPRPYPMLTKPICLMMVNYPTFVDQVHRRYPFFRSTFSERRLLFERRPQPRHSGGEWVNDVPARSQRPARSSGNDLPFVELDPASADPHLAYR